MIIIFGQPDHLTVVMVNKPTIANRFNLHILHRNITIQPLKHVKRLKIEYSKQGEKIDQRPIAQ